MLWRQLDREGLCFDLHVNFSIDYSDAHLDKDRSKKSLHPQETIYVILQ